MNPASPIATLVRAIQRRPGFALALLDDDGPTLADVPSKADLRAEARGRFAEALADYDRINSALTAQPIVAGRFYSLGRWVVRGEFADVPARYLDRSEKPATGALAADGSLDDRAEALGFDDGDALRTWMLEARRPRLSDFTRPAIALPYSAADVRAVQTELARESGCRGSNVASYCSSDVAEAVLREALAGRGDTRYRRAVKPQAERSAGIRGRRRESGTCTRCGREKAREGKTTCAGCNAVAAAAVKASRERRRAAAEFDAEAFAVALKESLGALH